MDTISETLSLSDRQVERLRTHLQEHRRRFDAFIEESTPHIEQLNEELRNVRPPEVEYLRASLRREEALAAVADTQAELDAAFLREVPNLLNENQAATWPRVVERVNRHRWLRRVSFYLEEGVDLIALVEQVEEAVDDNIDGDALTAVLANYSSQVSQLLTKIVEEKIQYARTFYRRHQDRGHWVVSGGRYALDTIDDPDWQKEFLRDRVKVRELHRRLRDLNRSTAKTVEAMLPEPLRADFVSAYNEERLRRVVSVGECQTSQFVEEVMEIDLGARQREDIGDMFASHLAARSQIFEQIVRAHDAWADARLVPGSGSAAVLQCEVDFRTELEALEEADDEVIAAVWGALHEEQQEVLERPRVAESQ